MRVVCIGKGGSGKTTLASVLARSALREGLHLLTIDGDVNVHLGPALGVPTTVPMLGNDYQNLFRALEGENPAFRRLQVIPECGSVPPGAASHRIRLEKTDTILQQYAWKSADNSWWHVQLGNYGTVDHGGDCYHYKQNALELFLHRIDDREEDLVLTDATAGVDHVATSLSVAYDLCLVAVEPTQKSVSVALDFARLTTGSGIRFAFVANKVESEQDLTFLREKVGADRILGYVPFSPELGRSEQGDLRELDALAGQCEALFAAVRKQAAGFAAIDRVSQRRKLIQIFERECQGYWNAYHGVNLLEFLPHEPHLVQQEARA